MGQFINMKQIENIKVFNTVDDLTKATALFIIEIAKNAVAERGWFIISLSGGDTPGQLYELLSKPPFREQLPWDKTFVFWGDERCVPRVDKQNNANMAKTLLLDHVAIPLQNIKPVPVNLVPQKAAIVYENAIKKFFDNEPPKFDLVLLGLGDNGHTASLFPGSDVVFEHTHLVKEVYVPEQKMYRVTMTADLINQAHNIIFLVTGCAKAEILKTVLTAPYQPKKYPAQLIKPGDGHLYWCIDKKAGALLG